MGLFDRDTDVSGGETGDSAGRSSSLAAAEIDDDDLDGTLKRVVDEEAGVVLYAYWNDQPGGLAAVPIDDTRLLDAE